MNAQDKQAIADIVTRKQVIAPQDIAQTIEQGLQAPARWKPINLVRGDQKIGGLIVVRGEREFDLVVALINQHCQPAEEKKP